MKKLLIIFCFTAFWVAAFSQQQADDAGIRVAETVMSIWKDSMALQEGKPAKWTYDQGLVLKGIEGIWKRTGDRKYFDYIQRSMDFFVAKDGKIRTYKASDYNIDNVLPGRNLLMLYAVTGKKHYYQAAQTLREQMKTHPRTKEGGFWHKKRYPWQMWLDGLYMAQPFLAEWAATYHEDSLFDDIANQFVWMENHARDAKTGLLYHGWDESKEQKWANKETGLSPHFWARAMGWYGMALVDALEWFPDNHPRKKEVIAILARLTDAIEKVQDPATGVWWDILDLPQRKGNYLESSSSSMFVYAIAKGVRLGYLPQEKLAIAKKGYDGILIQFIRKDSNSGLTNLEKTVQVSGLGGTPYRDGSFEYYIGEPVITNDPKGIGAFLKAANEMAIVPTLQTAAGKMVVLDAYFNHETKEDITGRKMVWHYQWNEQPNAGFSFLGEAFKRYGFTTSTLYEKPDKKSLTKADVYLLVDPDNDKDAKEPNYMDKQTAAAIAKWVEKGGVLVLLTNDSGNADLHKINLLSAKFGVQFKNNSINRVQNDVFEQGELVVPAGNEIFKEGRKLFLKEISSLEVKVPARTLLSHDGEVIMATAKYGKGAVFILGDPWLYNEYVDGRKLPAKYENLAAAEDLIRWIAKQLNASGN